MACPTTSCARARSTTDDVICVSYNCADTNTLMGVRFATTYNNFNNPSEPHQRQLLHRRHLNSSWESMNDSPTFNRLRASYTQFFPVDWLKIHKGCRPKAGEQADCPQAIGVQIKGGVDHG